MNSRRHALALAGALTATVFTAVAAVAGISHRPAAHPSPAPIVSVAPPAAPASSSAEWTDD
jgi:hypothetical protein